MQVHQLSWLHIYVISIWIKCTGSLSQTQTKENHVNILLQIEIYIQ